MRAGLLLVVLALAGGCKAAEAAAAKDPRTCEQDPSCAKQRGAYPDCTKQCADDPECMNRCWQIQQGIDATSK